MMNALVFERGKPLQLAQLAPPVIEAPDDVLIRIRATGVCGTDIHILGGAYPTKPSLILGHESTGEVAAVGPAVTRLAPGDRIVLDPTYFCGQCFYCLNDRPNYCAKKSTTETGVSRDGTFAGFHVAREAFVHRLPPEIDFATGTLSEPLACALYALRQTRVRAESRVLVIGLGPMGQLFGLATQLIGCATVAVDVSSHRVETARAVGIDARPELARLVGDRFDLVIDTSGCMFEQALPRVDRGGDLLLVGLNYRYTATLSPSYLTDNGIRLIGSIDTNRTFAPAIDMLRRHPVFQRIVTHRLAMADYRAGFALLGVDVDEQGRRGEIRATKVVLQP